MLDERLERIEAELALATQMLASRAADALAGADARAGDGALGRAAGARAAAASRAHEALGGRAVSAGHLATHAAQYTSQIEFRDAAAPPPPPPPPPRVSAGHRTSRERLYQSDIREPWAGGDSRATRDKAAALGARALGR